MKERPILFNGAMVRALLDGSKTQTRRAVKSKFEIDYLPLDLDGAIWPHNSTYSDAFEEQPMPCPYGQPGDQLWVREAWRAPLAFELTKPNGIPKGSPIVFQADGAGSLPHCNAGKLRPSMFMPRWASRLTLEIISVRVEQLQAISEADAIADGIDPTEAKTTLASIGMQDISGPVAEYSVLWEQINGTGSWDANPWVWVVEFKKVTP